ncbi:hypothetical protein [Solimonas variicoloris]|uniref:hypothetical protein n=1 Tax=Solimonas variicoloris TaxID=254408 RepID=UPI00037FBCC2|nr:hypothetical protein [Solimonas variicoloris]
MNAYHVFEILVVGSIVGYAAWNFASRFVPKLRRGGAKSAGCDGCSGGSCCDASTPKKAEQPIRFRR